MNNPDLTVGGIDLQPLISNMTGPVLRMVGLVFRTELWQR